MCFLHLPLTIYSYFHNNLVFVFIISFLILSWIVIHAWLSSFCFLLHYILRIFFVVIMKYFIWFHASKTFSASRFLFLAFPRGKFNCYKLGYFRKQYELVMIVHFCKSHLIICFVCIYNKVSENKYITMSQLHASSS